MMNSSREQLRRQQPGKLEIPMRLQHSRALRLVQVFCQVSLVNKYRFSICQCTSHIHCNLMSNNYFKCVWFALLSALFQASYIEKMQKFSQNLNSEIMKIQKILQEFIITIFEEWSKCEIIISLLGQSAYRCMYQI